MKPEIIKLRNIHCESCENAIRVALKKLPGVAQVAASADRNEVEVFYDDKIIDANELVAELRNAGYELASDDLRANRPASYPARVSHGETDTAAVRRARGITGLAGVCGSIACAASMVLPLVGLATAGVAAGGSMAGMVAVPAPDSLSGSHPGSAVGFLITIGPELLVVSTALVILSFTFRRKWAALPALFGGIVLYWGMYGQSSDALMYAAIFFGYLIWVGTYLWIRWPRLRVRFAGQ